MSADEKVAEKVRVLYDARVDAEFVLGYADKVRYDRTRGGFVPLTVAQRAVMLEEKCKEFKEFIRDHRSQDEVVLTVVRQYRDECSACHEEWDGDDASCWNCGAQVIA